MTSVLKPGTVIKPNPKDNAIKARLDAGAKMDAGKKAAEIKAMAETAAQMDAQKRAAATPSLRGLLTNVNTVERPPTRGFLLGGIRAANDVTNPEVMKQQTAMAASGKTNTGYEPPGSQYSSLASANKLGTAPVTPPSGPQILTASQTPQGMAIKKGGMIKKKKSTGKAYISGGKVSSPSKRGDGCAQRGKTKGRMV